MHQDNSRSDLTRRKFLGTMGAAFAFCSFNDHYNDVLTSKSKPNFLLVLTDDQRFDAMGFMGHPFLKTPNIDRLRNEGAWFKNAFCPSSLCSPSRASLLTGTYPSRHGVMANNLGVDFDFIKTPSYHQILRDNAGYKSAFLGKWHMGLQNDNPRPGFDYWLSFKEEGVYVDPELNENGRRFKAKGYITDILNDAALKWLDENGSEPFVMYVSHKAAHQPFIPADRHKGTYKGKQLNEPASYNDPMTQKPFWQRALVKDWVGEYYRSRDYRKENPIRDIPISYPKRDYKVQDFQSDYFETLLAADESLGALMDKLQAIGELDNTVIIFAGDNGFFMGEHRMGDKRCAYEESIRIPMLIRYPKLVKPGTTIEQMVMNIDIAPTFFELADVKNPSHIQGNSLVRLFKGSTDWRKSILYSYWVDINYPQYPKILAVRTDDFKLVTYPDTEEMSELYDLKNDPSELNNLINDPPYSKQLTQMKQELDRLAKETEYKESYAVLDKTKKQGLILKYDFEKCDGRVIHDVSGNSNRGIISHATIENTEKGAALKCSRESSIVIEQSESIDFSECPLSMSVWLKAESDGTVVSQGEAGKGAWSLFVENGIPCFGIRDHGRIAIADGMESCLGKWIHLTATINHNKMEMFVDGKKVAVVPRGRYLKLFGRKMLIMGKEEGKQTLGMIPTGCFQGYLGCIELYRQLKNDLYKKE